VKIQSRDIITVIALIGALILLALGIDHLVEAVISAVVVFYFGHGVYEKRRNSRSRNS
jgi:uncharacterized membrane protein YGL010W